MKKGKTVILVIDDEEASLEIIAGSLEDAGYGVIKARRPEKGLVTAAEECPDLIILDWHMPQMDGLQVLRRLKADKSAKEIPVVMATGIKTESSDLKQALDAGAVDFIRKPIDDVELLARVQSALRLVEYYNETRRQISTIHRQEKQIINQKAEEFKKELEFKKLELVNNALQLLEIMENTSGMITEFRKLNLPLDDESADKLKQLFSRYQNYSFDVKWAEFERRFDEVHTGFYQNLLKHHPNLSANERKLCVYFMMDMANKDIAALTFSSYDAVRKAHLRLKAKLGLTSDQSLAEFLARY